MIRTSPSTGLQQSSNDDNEYSDYAETKKNVIDTIVTSCDVYAPCPPDVTAYHMHFVTFNASKHEVAAMAACCEL
jgi:hypothetical protein